MKRNNYTMMQLIEAMPIFTHPQKLNIQSPSQIDKYSILGQCNGSDFSNYSFHGNIIISSKRCKVLIKNDIIINTVCERKIQEEEESFYVLDLLSF